MHLLAAKPGGFTDDDGIIDLKQTPADIVIFSSADSVLAALANCAESLPDDSPSIRLANWMQLLKPAAFDLYQDKVLDHAKIIIVSLLGGANYWRYGFEQLIVWSERDKNRKLVMIPGDDATDDELFNVCTVNVNDAIRIWRYLRQGGATNHYYLFHFLFATLFKKGSQEHWHEPEELPQCLVYMPRSTSKHSSASLNEWKVRWQMSENEGLTASKKASHSICVVLFYRSHLQSANMAMFDELITTLESNGLKPLPIAITSLKDPDSLSLVNKTLIQAEVNMIINTTGFASHSLSRPTLSSQPSEFTSPFVLPIPVFQLILSSSTLDDWDRFSQGLRSRDIAMQIVLPEMDGRIISRAISFKSEAYFSSRCQITVVRYELHQERANFVAQLVKRFCLLAEKENSEKRMAFIVANYPTKDGRIGNGVGLDTPESTLQLLHALSEQGYPINTIPNSGTELIKKMLGAITNNPNTLHQLPCWQSISLEDYLYCFHKIPEECQKALMERWGEPTKDPKYRNGRIMISGIRLGETFVGIQPARGFNIDLLANYHDPDLVPPHSYLAFYFWLRHIYQVDAIVHVGKHGNLEWLPGKGKALSEECWPDIALGPMPHFYPFIVNDPGEGAQAKRRAQAVIIDHLMPPMTRAEVYGDLAELEVLVDEYYQAMGMDPRREKWLKEKIIDEVKSKNVFQELALKRQHCGKDGLDNQNQDDDVLEKLDAYLCDIKEAQIRHGLHILGKLPSSEKLSDTLVALLRLPRGKEIESEGILNNLSQDLCLSVDGNVFDPLQATTKKWLGNKPDLLSQLSEESWRTEADTRERLEFLSMKLIETFVLKDGVITSDIKERFPATSVQLLYVKTTLLGALKQSVVQELSALTKGLNGEFIEPGPSGAPTRGRLDVLPTGRNFFSVDNRAIPSKVAWILGEQSAQALIDRHLQEHGDYPLQMGLSVWGTATMRTGGDDIAQAFALMGVKPIWALGSQRVIDFEITPALLLRRPRVDVTLRVSGFFRDAFPNVMALYDAAVRAIAEFDEPGGTNTIQKNIKKRVKELMEEGLTVKAAKREASYRVFGSKPGAYGAGLQGLIDERCWETRDDLADAFLNWGGYAYGSDQLSQDGIDAKASFKNRLSQLQAVVHNQDNREHDLLDSDDYYQFQGGMSNAVTAYSGNTPVVYHNDHSNPTFPKVRTLKEELNRVIRSRVLNPKWINGMREHGYKGAFEMAASVDYLFAYDATTNLIDDYQYESVSEALIFDESNKTFMQEHNPNAFEEMVERMLEAVQRKLWQEPGEYAERLQDILLEIDATQEKFDK